MPSIFPDVSGTPILNLMPDPAGSGSPAVVIVDVTGAPIVSGLSTVFTFDAGGQVSSHILEADLGLTTDTSGPSSPTFQRVVAVPV